MKTKTIFRKPRVIITAVVLAVLVALAAAVIVLAADEATFAGVRVTTSGKLNMEFYYTINDKNAGVTKARVEISDGEFANKEEYVDLVDTDDGKVVAVVRLDAAEMGYTVTVTPVTDNGNGKNACDPQTWSVRKYAETVLANPEYVDDYAPLKAILNYGQYAKEYFANVKGITFDPEVEDITDGIFTRLSNPTAGIASKIPAATEYTLTSNNEVLIPQDSLELAMVLNDTIELRLYYAYNEESGAHTGMQNYDESKGKYFVKVGLIDTEHFTSDYGVKLGVNVNGNAVVTVENATVLNFVATLANSDNEYTKNLARAMYYYYYWTNDDVAETIDRATCKHTAIHWEAIDVTDAESASYATCTLCGFKTSIAVPNSVNYFSAPGQYKNVNNTTHTLVNDEDGIYTHIALGSSPQFVFDGTTGKGGIAADEPIFGGAGNYIVFRMRTGNTKHMCLRLNSDHSSVSTNGNSYAMGQYDTGNFGLNWRNSDGATVAMDTWYTYVIDLSKFANVLYPWADKLAAQGDTEGVQNIGAGMFFHGASAGAYIDVQYFAIVDSWEEVSELIGEDTQVTYTNWKNGSIDKARYANGWCMDDGHVSAKRDVGSVERTDYQCCDVEVQTYCSYCSKILVEKEIETRAHDLKLTKNGNVASYTCTGCNDTFNSYYDGTSADYFVTAGGYVAGDTWQSYSDGVVTMDSDNMIYQRFRCDGSQNDNLNATNTHHGGVDLFNGVNHKYTTVNGLSDYLVIKVNTTGITNVDFVIGVNGTALNVCQNSRNWKDANGWTVYVIDLKAMAEAGRIKGYSAGTAVESFSARIIPCVESANLRHNTFDIAYAALVTGWDNVEALVGEGEEILYTQWPAGTDTVLESDGTCVGDCVLTNDNIVVEGDTIKYLCNNKYCTNQVLKTITRPTVGEGVGEINFYSAAGQQWNNWHTTDTMGGKDNNSSATTAGTLMTEGDTFFNRIYVRESGGFKFFTGNTSAVVHGFKGETGLETIHGGSGKLAVMKIRTSGRVIYFGLTNGSTSSFDSSLLTGFNRYASTYQTDGDWSVIVIDLTQINSGSKYAIDENLQKAGFGIRVSGESTGSHYIDVQYFAVCDNWAEVETVVGSGEDVYYTKWTDQGNDVKLTLDGTCKHRMTYTKVDNTYTYACLYCDKTETRTVLGDVNYYSAPGQYINFWASGTKPMTGNNNDGGHLQGATSVTGVNMYDEAENTAFTRIYLNVGSQFEFTNGTGTHSTQSTLAEDTINGGMGRYIVLKVRLHNVNQLSIGLGSGDIKAENNMKTRTGVAKDVWHTYVIDVSGYNTTPFKEDATVKKIAASIQTKGSNTAGAYVDVAYFAICSNWTEINNVTGDDATVAYFTDFANGAGVEIVDGRCVGEHAYAAKYTETSFHLECVICSAAKDERVFGDSVNYYSAPGQMAAGYNTKVSLVTDDGDFAYTHVKFSANGQARFHNVAGKNTVMKDRDDTIKGGPGRYVVMKVRVGNTLMENFGIGLWDGNKALSTAAPYSEGNPNVDAIFGASGNTRKISQAMVDEGWAIYVVDIASLSQDWYSINDTETDLISAGIKAVSGGAQNDSSWIDIAYFAIVDNWAEAQAVIGNDTSTAIKVAPSWKNASNDEVHNLDGSCADDHKLSAPVISTNENGDTVYTYNCSGLACGATFTRVNPQGTNFYSAPGQQLNNWASAASPLAGGTSGSSGFSGNYMVTTKFDADHGVYNRVYLNQGGHFFLTNGSVDAAAHKSEAVVDVLNNGVGQFAVFKIRVNDNPDIGIRITTNLADTKLVMRGGTENGFVTYVVDISGVKSSDATKVRVYISGSTGGGVPAGSSVDVAYFAIVEDWAMVEKVVGEGETVLYCDSFVRSNGGSDDRYSDGSCCGDHVMGYAQDGNSYTYKCELCGHVEKTFSVGAAGVNWFTPANQQFGYSRQNVTGYGNKTVFGNENYDYANNVKYTRVPLGSWAYAEILNGSSDPDVDGNPTQTIYGTGNYLVIKMRASSSLDHLSIVAVDGKTGNNVFNPWMSDHNRRYQVSIEDGWAVYVVPFNTWNGCAAYSAGDASRDKALFALCKNIDVAGDYVDVAYFAICDSWAEIQSIVADETVVYGQWGISKGATNHPTGQTVILAEQHD